MFKAIGNVLGKGLKVASHVVVGSLAFGLYQAATNWHPASPALELLWQTTGVGLATGVFAAIMRAVNFDPSKLGK